MRTHSVLEGLAARSSRPSEHEGYANPHLLVSPEWLAGLMGLSLLWLLSPDCLLARRVFRRSRWRGLMLLFILWGSLGLLAGVLFSGLSYLWPVLTPGGNVRPVFSLLMDLAGGLLLAGLTMALARRYVWKPERWVAVASDGLLLTLLALVVGLGFLMEGLRLVGTTPVEGWPWPVGTTVGWLLGWLVGQNPAVLSVAYTGLLLLHAGLALSLLAYLPFSKLFHLLAAQITTRAAAQERRPFPRPVEGPSLPSPVEMAKGEQPFV